MGLEWKCGICVDQPELCWQGLGGGSNRKALVIGYIDKEGGRQFNTVLVLSILCYITRFQMANYDPLVKQFSGLQIIVILMH